MNGRNGMVIRLFDLGAIGFRLHVVNIYSHTNDLMVVFQVSAPVAVEKEAV